MARLIKKPDDKLGKNLHHTLWDKAVQSGISLTKITRCEDGWLADGLIPYTLNLAFWVHLILTASFRLKSQTHEYSHEHPQE